MKFCLALSILVSFIIVLPVTDMPGHAFPRMCAEWEPALGTLIRWPLGIPSSLVMELAEDDSLYVLVENTSQETQARAAFSAWGVNINHCRFIYADTYSHWTRDWGPHSVFDENGRWSIADPIFDGYPWVSGCDDLFITKTDHTVSGFERIGRGYEEDDLVNTMLAPEFSCPLISFPAYLTGGNIMVDGHGTAFSTRQMFDENSPLWPEDVFKSIAEDSLGITDYVVLSNPDLYGLQHIDCWAKLLDEETILVKELPSWHDEYECIETVVDELSELKSCYDRPYRIVRVFCGAYSGTRTAAYTNSLILNGNVFVPLFNIFSDNDALETYEEAMPGYEITGIPYNAWYYYDALHCRTMGIYDRHMLRISHRRLDSPIFDAPEYDIVVMIDDRSEQGLIESSLGVTWRLENQGNWEWIPLETMAAADSFVAYIPGTGAGTTIQYYISASDSSGRYQTYPPTAPEGYVSFSIVEGIENLAISTSADSICISWQPIPGADYYRMYSSEYPYRGFSIDSTGIFTGTVWNAPIPDAYRYYRVTALSH